MADPKAYRPILTELEIQGWTVERTAQGHRKATPPDSTRGLVHFSLSGDPRAIQNTIKDLQKNGFVWPPPPKSERRSGNGGGGAPIDWSKFNGPPPDETSAPLSEPEPETNEDRMERLFRELRDAKAYVTLTNEQLVDRQKALEAARAAFEEASAEHQRAAEGLKTKKAEFDQAFEEAA